MLGLTILDWAILVGYFVVILIIGVVATRLIKNREDYLMGGRRFGTAFSIFYGNCAVFMLSFAGIYTNNIHKKIWPQLSDERALLRIGRVASILFAFLATLAAFAFTDVPAAMRFIWMTTPLMGVPFFLAVLWKRANRQGAFASFFVSLAAMLIGKYYFHWEGNAGLPKTITLFLTTGIAAGVLVSLATAPEQRRKLEQFFLLLRTPVGQEDLLHQAGLTEIPGTGSFELADETAPGVKKALTAEEIARLTPDRRRARMQTWVGFLSTIAILFTLLGSVILLARWLAGGN